MPNSVGSTKDFISEKRNRFSEIISTLDKTELVPANVRTFIW